MPSQLGRLVSYSTWQIVSVYFAAVTLTTVTQSVSHIHTPTHKFACKQWPSTPPLSIITALLFNWRKFKQNQCNKSFEKRCCIHVNNQCGVIKNNCMNSRSWFFYCRKLCVWGGNPIKNWNRNSKFRMKLIGQLYDCTVKKMEQLPKRADLCLLMPVTFVCLTVYSSHACSSTYIFLWHSTQFCCRPTCLSQAGAADLW